MSVEFVDNGAALLSMRNSDFDAYSAFGEVVDNSVQADATEIRVRFDYVLGETLKSLEPIRSVAFGDNGTGMDAATIHRCLQLGYSSRYNDRGGIGRFGVGATLAAINQCQKVEVYSKQKGCDWLYTYIDLQEITDDPPVLTAIPEPTQKDIPSELVDLVGADHGTLVIWSKYDRQPTDASEMIEEFHIWSGRTYREFLWNGVSITINGVPVKVIDPLYVRTDQTKFPDDEPAYEFDEMDIEWPVPLDDRVFGGGETSTVKIRFSLLPEFIRPTQGSGNSTAVKERYIDRNEGVSIMRNGREVFYGRIPYWPGKTIQEIDRFWGCEISFDAVLDKEFTVKNIKRGAIPVKELKKAISDKIEPTRHTALEQVREVWLKARASKKTTNTSSTIDSGHTTAEKTAQRTATPKNKIDQDKDRKEEIDNFTENWIKHADEKNKAAWKAKFEAQPFTIVDDEWRGPEFFETAHLGGRSVLKYNMRHSFFNNLEDIRIALEEEDADNENALRLKALLDLMLISYAKAEAMLDADLNFSAENFIEQIRMSWGNYLANYINTYEREGQS